MTDTDLHATPATPDRSITMLVAAAALVVVVVAAVLAFGVERPPSFEPLSAAPSYTPPGEVAWTVWDDDENCLMVAAAGGEVREVVCGDVVGDEVVGWTGDGILMRVFDGGDPSLAAVDPVTGERTLLDGDARFDDTEGFTEVWVRTTWQAGTLRVSVSDGSDGDTEVWEFEAPRSYDILSVTRSPDGRAVAMLDSAGRLLVAPSDASGAPRLWSDDVARYGRLVWEGSDPARGG